MDETSVTAVAGDKRCGELPRRPLDWLKVFGPGAIIASLTIGTGELIFSSRGGAIFGYRILFLFIVISLLKWGLVVASSRHMVLTGVHPYRRMLDLPGPRGWLPMVLLLIATVCLPIWISFHSGVLGNLTAWITGTSGLLGGGVDYLWGAGILALVVTITSLRGYSTLERIQLIIVAAMVLSAGVTLILYNPDWLGLSKGAVVPQPYAYPDWLGAEYPHIAGQPVWVETTRYVGVIGGAGFDYLAYTSFMRDKAWGQAGAGPASAERLAEIAAEPAHPVRRWARAPLIDCSISFLVIVAFSAVFVASGTLILGPNHKIPDEKNLLNLQAAFVTGIHPWLLPLYVAGAFLTMIGTLYGTMEVACSIAGEMAHAFSREFAVKYARKIRRVTIVWCAVGACAILLFLFAYQSTGGMDKRRQLMTIFTPANLFTGVLLCGLLCLVNLWMDRKFVPKALRLPPWLWLLNLVSGFLFLGLGVKGYLDHESRPYAIGSLCAMLAIAAAGAHLARKWTTRADE
ncbi:MAG: Nramp family divalent metal transporter [Planctomycetota bacterium]|jgi:Mn2+/Fe2+ NRAMP family transporter